MVERPVSAAPVNENDGSQGKRFFRGEPPFSLICPKNWFPSRRVIG
jgi:hypothetical protein